MEDMCLQKQNGLQCSVDVGEALGLYEALQWVAELGFTTVWTSHWIRSSS